MSPVGRDRWRVCNSVVSELIEVAPLFPPFLSTASGLLRRPVSLLSDLANLWLNLSGCCTVAPPTTQGSQKKKERKKMKHVCSTPCAQDVWDTGLFFLLFTYGVGTSTLYGRPKCLWPPKDPCTPPHSSAYKRRELRQEKERVIMCSWRVFSFTPYALRTWTRAPTQLS